MIRPFHSTETAVVSILNDMITAVDSRRIGALMLLDLSAAFNTINHSVVCTARCSLQTFWYHRQSSRLHIGFDARPVDRKSNALPVA